MKSLIDQSLQQKIALARQLRAMLSISIPWVGGEVLASLAGAIAELEKEIDELTKDPSSNFPSSPVQQSCPMGHQCPKNPCAHRYLCKEVKSAER